MLEQKHRLKNCYLRLEKPRLRLYKAYSHWQNHPDLGDVRIKWHYNLRHAPLVPYEELIEGYSRLEGREREHAELDVDELFTKRELNTLKNFLKKKFGIYVLSLEESLPMVPWNRHYSMTAGRSYDNALKWGGIYLFGEEEGDDLPFDVRGDCDLD